MTGHSVQRVVVRYQGKLQDGLISGTYYMSAEVGKDTTHKASGNFEVGIGFIVPILKSLAGHSVVPIS